MKQISFFSMKRGIAVAVFFVAGCMAILAQDDDISALVNANCDPKVEVINDATYPWTISDGDLKGGATTRNTTSVLTLTYESAHKQYLEFSYDASWHCLTLLVDGFEIFSSSNGWTRHVQYIESGRHIIQFKDSIYTYNYQGPSYYTLLRNITIHEYDWLDITLSRAGDLGTEVLNKVDVLDDVVQLRIHGQLNDNDWEKIHLMKNLRDIDLSDAAISAIPDDEFNTCPYLRTALLPESLTSIGNSAFKSTKLASINIPANVASIGVNAFIYVKSLATVTIPSNTALKNIGEYAFKDCISLKSFNMPNSITSLGRCTFEGCTSLSSVVLSNGITTLDEYTFYGCTALSSIVLPNALQSIGRECFYSTKALTSIDFPQALITIGDNAFGNSGLVEVVLPQNLTTLGTGAFNYCDSVKYVELPVTPDPGNLYYNGNGYRSSFSYCTALEKVVCPSATPPLISSAPFYNIGISKVTLVVPAFAVVDYKLDPYWHDFGNIVGGAEPTQFRVPSTLSLTNDRRPANKTDITMTTNGRLVVSGNAPLEIGKLTFNTNYGNSGVSAQLLSQTPAISVDQVLTRFYAASGRWYFITPMHDINVNDISHNVADASFIFRYYNSQNRAANGPTGSWQNLLDNMLKAGQGYILQTNKAGWINLPATATGKDAVLVIDDVTTALNTYNATNNANANWNYVGNPYPCFYDTYYMDLTAPITVRDYSNNTYRAYSPVDDGYVLKPMEAFFVQKPTGQNQILFQQEGRQLTTEVQHSARAPKIGENSRQLFDLEITDGTHSDRTRIVMNPQASLAYEPAVDVTKFISMEADVPQLYTIDGEDNQLSINERPVGDGLIPLGLYASQAGTFAISLSRGNSTLLLIDNENGETIDLTQGSYTFTIDAGIHDSRFTVKVGAAFTNITEIENGMLLNSKYFDLQGRSVNGQLQKGIYVKNGKKYVVK